MKNQFFLIFTFLLYWSISFAQTGDIHGTVSVEGRKAEFVTIMIEELGQGSITGLDGNYHFHDIPFGTYTLTASYVGYANQSQEVVLSAQSPQLNLDWKLTETINTFDEIVVTGTKTFKRQTDSPIIVNVLTSQTLENVQACNLSEGLRFQPGLRVETDCQTCNYTQLRMNGLAGGYSQILINGRPIFSPLTGLYGLEQLPVNMIQRIEVIRGGGASLYGSSAIGGTVNVITKIPKTNDYELNNSLQIINDQSLDYHFMGNATLVSETENMGVSFFLNRRDRDFYDHNDDNFSELPSLENTSLGTNIFFLPSANQKVELSLSNLNEYRFGGEMIDKPAYLTQQSEERTHNIWMASADYQINFNQDKTALIAYGAWQNTDRDHYTGILPDEEEALQQHIENPPYGNSEVQTYNFGIQINHKINRFITGDNVLTLGAEYLWDDVYDKIPAYQYLIDQTTRNTGVFIQSDWSVLPQLSLLSGVRADFHNLMDDPRLSPRFSLLYKLKSWTQFRLSYGTGFRAPQAFDADLHIAFAGGGISRVMLSPDLQPEKSESWSASINYDRPMEHFIAGFTLEGFYTNLRDAFYLNPTGEDAFGEVFEKQNGQGATVQGLTLELRANYNRKAQIETGFTLQSSRFEEAVTYIDGVEGIRQFTRTPNNYGFANLNLRPNTKTNINLNYVYTGSMKVPHFAGAPNQTVDEIIDSKQFHEWNVKLGYTFGLNKLNANLECYTGFRNIFNAYQDHFDIGKNRDSNFVYGPAQPRTFFLGAKLSSK